MATKKRKGQGADKTHREKAPEGQTEQPENVESVEGDVEIEGRGRLQAAPMPIVAIGSSAGGLEALQEFFSHLPHDTGIAFVVVTHMRPGRDSMLPELLGAVTRMEVIHAGASTKVEPNKIIVARDSLLSISNGVLSPIKSDDKPEVSYHPIDHFFRSLADDKSEHAIGIILSGSGNDGSLGLKAIKAVGGMIMVQSPDTAKYSSMPESAIATHLADYVMPVNALPQALIDYCRGPYLQLVRRVKEPFLPENTIQAILVRLRAHSGQDFTCYKKSTMARRIQRRMTVHHIDEPQAYLSFLRENPHEVDALMEELLISVTSFFRDPAAWKALADDALPRLIKERADGQALRVWVPGCATGEEAYSVAILLQEQIRKAERSHPVQIFATDLDERAIDVARAGLYPEGISADVSAERLKSFFSREDGAYRIHKSIRDSIVFAMQNLISDPPFTRLDLIVCRNVLIYLDIGAQQHVLPNFHYALRPGGPSVPGPGGISWRGGRAVRDD
jgi:two-component system, chemotaxis family, CheB/CheR fusion protein